MKHCQQCGQEASGRFCASCGASLMELPCPSCQASVAAGTRFCTDCGSAMRARAAATPVGAGGDGRASRVGWWVSGGLLAVLVLVVLFVEFTGSGSDAAPPGGPMPGSTLGPAPNVDLSSMTAREAADNLFNRVMRAIAADDTSEAMNFLPMAIDAYEMARPLDEDGLFHLSLLERASGNSEGALAAALEGLEGNPDHLLNLSAAAESSRDLGQDDQAGEFYRRMLEAWDRERAELRVEYEEHAPLLPLIREDAEQFLSGSDP